MNTATGRGKQSKNYFWLLVVLMLAGLLVACGDAPTPTADYSGALTVYASRPTVTPPYQPVSNVSPAASSSSVAATVPVAQVFPTVTVAQPTPIFIPTPGTPTEAVITSDDLGISGWTETEINWSPKGDQFILHVMRGEDQADFYFLMRPPNSPVASFKLSRTTFGAINWSRDGKYLSYIDQDLDGNPGPVKLIDTVNAPTIVRELSKGPCTNVAWLNPTKLVAACGTIIYGLSIEGDAKPDVIYKLDGTRFPGSNLDLSVVARALPSPNGAYLAMFGLARQKSSVPLGEIAFLDLNNSKVSILDRNNRAIAMVDWTPDSKYLVLRNLTGDWAVPYTFDFYLADPAKQKIVQNVTKTNEKCDPVLGAKADCQGLQPSPYQALRLSVAPDGSRYFFTGVNYVAQPGAALETVELVTGGTINGKQEKPVKMVLNDKIVGFSWLPNNHYFYSVSPLRGAAKAFLDGKPLALKSNALNTLITSGTPVPRASAKSGPTVTRGAAILSSNISGLEQTTGTPSTFLTPSTSPNRVIGDPPAPATATPPVSGSPNPSPSPSPAPTATAPIIFPSITTGVVPNGTQIIQVYTATPEKATATPRPVNPATPRSTPTVTPDTNQLRPMAFFISPTGNWVISLERIAGVDKPVQFQLRLIPYSLK